MTVNGWLQIFVFLALILFVTKPMGIFMARVFSRERTFLDPVLRPIERLLYRVCGVDENHEMRWTEYATAMLLFSLAGFLSLYALLDRNTAAATIGGVLNASSHADTLTQQATAMRGVTDWKSSPPISVQYLSATVFRSTS